MNDSLSRWRQPHDFRHAGEGHAETRLKWVIAITFATMVAELVGGYAFGSMALVADGWHMGSHAAALSISVLGYVASRRLIGHSRFTFGTGKIGPLAGYSSALLLGLVWPYLTLSALGMGPGALIAGIGAAALVVSGILALVIDRHAEASRPV